MKIIIKAQKEKGEVDMVFSNEMLNNSNYIDIIIEGEEYSMMIEDLYQAIKVFRALRYRDEE